jgi:membrane associated rhomboid family serine protease
MVLGARVNALLGNTKMAVVYPMLAIAGGAAHAVMTRAQPAGPMLGASGAIMGLAGMYVVLFPVYRVHVATWIRVIFTGFRLGLTFFTIRGFWVVLFYIMFDVAATAIGKSAAGGADDVAHWAHLGGFIAGMGIALMLLVTRLVDAHGGDILSVTLGKRAWLLLGRPSRRAGTRAIATTHPA